MGRADSNNAIKLLENKVIIATRNEGKVKEFSAMFSAMGADVLSLADFDGLPEIIEDGETFQHNAAKKAITLARLLGLPVLADDSGLCVDALDGEPGVYSARYAGAAATDALNNAKLLRRLSELDRGVRDGSADGAKPVLLSKAHFQCVLALHDPQQSSTLYAEGVCEGYITSQPRGTGGFGYDPLFYLPQLGKTMAELSKQQKNQISHRSAALKQLIRMLTTEA